MIQPPIHGTEPSPRLPNIPPGPEGAPVVIGGDREFSVAGVPVRYARVMPEGSFAVFTAAFADIHRAMGDRRRGDLVGVALAALPPVRALHFEPAYFYGPDYRDLNPVGGSMRYWLNNKTAGTQRPSRGPIVFVAGPELSLTDKQITVLRAQHNRSLEIARRKAEQRNGKRGTRDVRQTALKM